MKYIIQKTDGTPVDPNAVYWVLRIDNHRRADYIASREALKAYIRESWESDNAAAMAASDLLRDTTIPDTAIPVSEKAENMVTCGGHDFGSTPIRPMTEYDLPPPRALDPMPDTATSECHRLMDQITKMSAREHDIVREAGDYDVVAVIRDLRNQLHDVRTLRSKYATELQQVAEAVGMPIAPANRFIHRVKELVAHETGPWINLAEHQELQERFKNLAAEYKKQGAVVESGLQLINFLDKNCGETSDWPVRILIDDEGAGVVPLMNNLRDAAKVYLANAESSNPDREPRSASSQTSVTTLNPD